MHREWHTECLDKKHWHNSHSHHLTYTQSLIFPVRVLIVVLIVLLLLIQERRKRWKVVPYQVAIPYPISYPLLLIGT